MNILIISDIHHRVDWVVPCLTELKGKYDKVVFLGDFFDNWNDTHFTAMKTASWLHDMINTDEFGEMVFLLGNHDIFYRNPSCQYPCSGNTSEKARAINSKMTKKDWCKLKLHYHVKDSRGRDWFFSHAGLTKYHFSHPINGFYSDRVNDLCEEALNDLKVGKVHSILGCGYARYGECAIGGITWCDWNQEFEAIPDVNQVVGHTIVEKPICVEGLMSENFNLDCNNRYLGLWKDGKMKLIKNKWMKEI